MRRAAGERAFLAPHAPWVRLAPGGSMLSAVLALVPTASFAARARTLAAALAVSTPAPAPVTPVVR